MKVSLRRKIVLGFSLALVLFGAIALVAYRSTRILIQTAEGVAHTREVLETQGSLRRDLVAAENGALAHLLGAKDTFSLAFDKARAQALADAELLRGLVADKPAQSDRLDLIQPLITRQLATLGQAVEARSDASAVAAILGSPDYQSRKKMLGKALDGFQAEEQGLLGARAGAARRTGRVAAFVIIGGTLLTFACLVTAGTLILRDIAARRRAEEALASEHNLLQNILNAIPSHVFVQDTRGRYIVSNRAHTKFLGLGDESELENKTAFDLFPQELASLYQADSERVLKGESILGADEPSVDREGKLIWLDTTKVPLCDIRGNTIGLVGISSDITQQKEADDRMRQFADQLERSNRALQDFASVASHDLQEPLRKIQAFGDRLRACCGDLMGEKGRDYLERMQNAANRMQTLIRDLLTLSRVTSNAHPFVELDLAEVVKGVLSDLEVRIEQTGAQLELGNLPKIEADALQMRQLFQNLIANALKFSKAGETPKVVVAAKILPVQEPTFIGANVEQEVCRVVVQDNGIGFDQKYSDRIFALFQRLHSREEYEGTGIGLAVCRKILDRHGGSIMAKSVPGEGSTFIVTLPVKQIMKGTEDYAR